MVYSKIRFFTSWMDFSGESRDTCFFVNYKRGLTLPKTELNSMSKRKLTTKFEEELRKCISIFDLPSSTLHLRGFIRYKVLINKKMTLITYLFVSYKAFYSP